MKDLEAPAKTAAEIAEHIGGALTGDGRLVVRDVAPLERAGSDAVSWLASAEWLGRAAKSKAGLIIAPVGCDVGGGRPVIHVADPDVAICEVLVLLGPPPETVPEGVHPTAVVSAGAEVNGAAIGALVYVGAGAKIGPGTQLHPGVHVGSFACIGRDCVLWPHAVVRERVHIGDRVIIHPNATIGTDGFGYLQRDGAHRKIPQIGTVVIEDDVEIGANTAIDRARSGVTRIRRGTKIDNLVQIAHNVELGEDCMIVSLCGIAGSATLGRGVVLGAEVGIADHVRLGDGVQVAGGGKIRKNIPDGQLVGGDPQAEFHEYQRRQVALRRLPEAMRRLRELERCVAQLEKQLESSQ